MCFVSKIFVYFEELVIRWLDRYVWVDSNISVTVEETQEWKLWLRRFVGSNVNANM